MSCLSAVHSQIMTFFSSPYDILTLRHKVFLEYAKTAVGPDFIHTLPTLLILTAIGVLLWRNPPSWGWLAEILGSRQQYMFLQIAASWVATNTVLWIWLVLQRILYCCVWTYWSYETEYRHISYQWWQRVWSAYYPPVLQPPVMSAGFISWIISMSFGMIALSCAFSTNRLRIFIEEALNGLRDTAKVLKYFANFLLGRLTKNEVEFKTRESVDEEKFNYDKCHLQATHETTNQLRREIRPISYGTNWVPKPNFSTQVEAQRKLSAKSVHTLAVVNDIEDPDKLSPRQLRQRRACHTVVPCNSSDISSES